MSIQQRRRIEGRTNSRGGPRPTSPSRQRRPVAVAAAAIFVVVAVMVAAKVLTGQNSVSSSDGPVPPEVLATIENVPADVFDQIGQGTATVLPSRVRSTISRGPKGLPLITYVGAEYCPFCAAERWSLVLALSRFGQFNDLQATHSAGDDIFPNTSTFSFVKASFTSAYVDFSAVELQSNVRSGQSYAPLQTPTAEQKQILQKYDSPPYVPQSSAGAIPFIDIADQYVLAGASYDAGVLRGQSMRSIAQALADPSSAQASAIVGGANALTAALCESTGNEPGNVCGSSAIQELQAKLVGTAG